MSKPKYDRLPMKNVCVFLIAALLGYFGERARLDYNASVAQQEQRAAFVATQCAINGAVVFRPDRVWAALGMINSNQIRISQHYASGREPQ